MSKYEAIIGIISSYQYMHLSKHSYYRYEQNLWYIYNVKLTPSSQKSMFLEKPLFEEKLHKFMKTLNDIGTCFFP